MYTSYIRPLIEYSNQLWSTSVTLLQRKSIISVEKRCLSIILGKFINRSNYEDTIKELTLTSINERMDKLFLEFGISVFKSTKYNSWLTPHLINSTRSRRSTDIFETISFKTDRYGNSTIPQLLRYLNNCDPELLKINDNPQVK